MKKIIFLTIFILIACNKNADLQSPSTNSSESLNGKQNNEKSLQWSEKSSHEMDWNAAINYCKNLNEDGYSDWRLPNIDELRTLIQNHSGTQTGGTCQISEKARKLSWGDRTNDCNGRNRSNFSKLGDSGWFWSSSVRSDDSYGAWWVVYFDDGGVLYDIKDHENYVRCVR